MLGFFSQGRIVQEAWDAQLHFLNVASKCSKPDDARLKLLLAPLQECLKEAGTLCRRDEWQNHTKTISEGLGACCFLYKTLRLQSKPSLTCTVPYHLVSVCINWLVVSLDAGLLPKDVAESAIGGSDYWANKVRPSNNVV